MLGRHVESDERVAVKTMTTNQPNAVKREIAAMRRAGAAPNICALKGYFQSQDETRFSLVMELCAGGELYAKVDEGGALPEADAWRYFRGIAAGLVHIHQRGIAHRDLKLENVLLGGPQLDTPKICDFGLAHIYMQNAEGTGFDVSPSLSQWCGTRSYCAPEIMARLAYDGLRADLWSLGVCLFAMVSGFFPVEEATQRDWRFQRLAMQQLRGDGSQSTTHTIYGFYTRPCPLSPALVELLDRMLAIRPPHRLPLLVQGAECIASAPWVVSGPTAAPGLTPPPRPTPPAASAAGAAAGATAAGAAAGATAAGAAAAGIAEVDMVDAVETVDRSAVALPATTAPPRVRRQRARSQRVGADENDNIS